MCCELNDKHLFVVISKRKLRRKLRTGSQTGPIEAFVVS